MAGDCGPERGGSLRRRILRRRPVPGERPATFQRVTFRNGLVTNARFTPDGRSVVYTGKWDGGPARVYMATPGIPDSRNLGFPDGSALAVMRGVNGKFQLEYPIGTVLSKGMQWPSRVGHRLRDGYEGAPQRCGASAGPRHLMRHRVGRTPATAYRYAPGWELGLGPNDTAERDLSCLDTSTLNGISDDGRVIAATVRVSAGVRKEACICAKQTDLRRYASATERRSRSRAMASRCSSTGPATAGVGALRVEPAIGGGASDRWGGGGSNTASVTGWPSYPLGRHGWRTAASAH